MERKGVTSSNIASAGYDAATKTLEVEFSGGAVYQYLDVPQAVYDGLMASASAGSYLAANIKGSYSYKKV